MPLGALPEIPYANYAYTLLPGQAVLLYTDGVVEARDAQKQMLDFEGLQEIIAHKPGERLVDTILEQVTQFVGSAALEDDVTLVVIQRVTDHASHLTADR